MTCSKTGRRPTLSDTVERLLRGEQVRRLLDALPERERRILELHFGLDNNPQSLEAISRKIGLTRERVRQLERRALARLGPALGHRASPEAAGAPPGIVPLRRAVARVR